MEDLLVEFRLGTKSWQSSRTQLGVRLTTAFELLSTHALSSQTRYAGVFCPLATTFCFSTFQIPFHLAPINLIDAITSHMFVV